MELRRYDEVVFWANAEPGSNVAAYDKVYDLKNKRMTLISLVYAPQIGDTIRFKLEEDLGKGDYYRLGRVVHRLYTIDVETENPISGMNMDIILSHVAMNMIFAEEENII